MVKPFETTCSWCGKTIIRSGRVGSLHFCNHKSCYAEWQKTTKKPVTEEWLRDAYIVKGMSCTQIAQEVGRDQKSVWNWMKGFGIPTRKRGHTGNLSFVKVHGMKGKHHSTETRERMSAIAKADGRVPYDPKIGSYMKGKKGADAPSWKGGLTPERQAFYASSEWSDAVKAIWKRDDAICQRCKLDHRSILRGTIRFHIHHIDSFIIRERRDVVDNLILLCEGCHKWVHSKKNKRRLYLGEGN